MQANLAKEIAATQITICVSILHHALSGLKTLNEFALRQSISKYRLVKNSI